jgi:hypothetical protein
MRRLSGAMAAAAGLLAAGTAAAAPVVEIRDAVARVIVSPEARSDIQVEIVRPNPRLPLRVWSFAGRTYVDGGLAHRISDCRTQAGEPSVSVIGVGEISADAMPQIVIHTPMDARVVAGGAVWGQVGRTAALDLANAGCGDWQVANVRGKLKLTQAASGSIRAGLAGAAELYDAGSGSIITREVSGPVTAMNVGSGQIDVGAVNGAFDARIAGSGHVHAAAGHASLMKASIAGSGDIGLNGTADVLKASVVGSGDVRVTKVTGQVSKAVIGSGMVRIG